MPRREPFLAPPDSWTNGQRLAIAIATICLGGISGFLVAHLSHRGSGGAAPILEPSPAAEIPPPDTPRQVIDLDVGEGYAAALAVAGAAPVRVELRT